MSIATAISLVSAEAQETSFISRGGGRQGSTASSTGAINPGPLAGRLFRVVGSFRLVRINLGVRSLKKLEENDAIDARLETDSPDTEGEELESAAEFLDVKP
ncbi:hypothetical protein Dda_4039 [Drechslerella dactyloides]|uniref:Uncharacterized protein n=1 Tax=Drechslerella dactyloides TaxID=74499 RepID=A0AAD6NK29_DREDA|nr:hypothetical protein Dda_4039 [Drechslerella dactyloides]